MQSERSPSAFIYQPSQQHTPAVSSPVHATTGNLMVKIKTEEPAHDTIPHSVQAPQQLGDYILPQERLHPSRETSINPSEKGVLKHENEPNALAFQSFQQWDIPFHRPSHQYDPFAQPASHQSYNHDSRVPGMSLSPLSTAHPVAEGPNYQSPSNPDGGGGEEGSHSIQTPRAVSLSERTSSIYTTVSEHGIWIGNMARAVHDTCLRASRTYLDMHYLNRVVRGSRLHQDDRNAHLCHVGNARGADSLLANVSGICNMLWAGSQRDRLDVLNVERVAAETMVQLLSWAEAVALGDPGDDDALWKVMDAGHNLCSWLDVEGELRGMERLRADAAGRCGVW